MIISKEAKLISDLVRRKSRTIRPIICDAFETSIVGQSSEVAFFRALITELDTNLSNLSGLGLKIWCRTAEIHAKPRVQTPHGNCELGDVLVVVKYNLATAPVEAKSIIYQVKLSKRNSLTCDIDSTQLQLLCDWPVFKFGRTATGLQQYVIKPNSLEFGSYMLEPRGPMKNNYLFGKYKCYGVSPYAELVRQSGPKSIKMGTLQYTRGDVNNFFSHLAFEIGEHHRNQPVKQLIDALYRYVGLAPDPPDEFKDFWIVKDDDAFAVIEINIALEAESELFRLLKHRHKPRRNAI